MMRSLWTAGTGMLAQQLNIDIISNNLSNVNTVGFKKKRAEFEDLLYQTIRGAGSTELASPQPPAPLQVGMGARLAATNQLFMQGNTQQTGNPLDVMIDGDGFFQVLMPDDRIAYTRSGDFKIDGLGRILTSDGNLLQPEFTVPEGASNLTITSDGTVTVLMPGEIQPQVIGQIELVKFINPAGLDSIGNNLWLQTGQSGEPVNATPGTEGMGGIIQGSLEMSNVQVVEEMVNMIVAQRAYDVNSKAIQASDEMLQVASNLRR